MEVFRRLTKNEIKNLFRFPIQIDLFFLHVDKMLVKIMGAGGGCSFFVNPEIHIYNLTNRKK